MGCAPPAGLLVRRPAPAPAHPTATHPPPHRSSARPPRLPAQVKPAGLGARDSLRLEAGLCLYGHDIDGATTPGEAGLAWTIGKRKRAAGGFLGSAPILAPLNAKSFPRRRVGLALAGAPAREGAAIDALPPGAANAAAVDPAAATRVGVVTSGTFAPCLKAPIAMGYVAPGSAADGTALGVEVRGKLVPARVTRMPFVPARYYKPAGAK